MSDQSVSPEAIFQQAMQAHQTGQPQQAIALLEDLLQRLPDDDAVLAALGAIQLSTGNVEVAKSILEQALASNPNNVDAQVNMGIVLQSTGDVAAGIDKNLFVSYLIFNSRYNILLVSVFLSYDAEV